MLGRDWDGWKLSQNVLLIVVLILMLIVTALDETEWDMTALRLGYVDPFMILDFLWIWCMFMLKGAIPRLRRISYQFTSGTDKGTLTSLTPIARTKEKRYEGERVAAILNLHRCGGTSKPKFPGFSGVRFVAYPMGCSKTLGGVVIIMAKMKTFRKKEHIHLGPHVLEVLDRLKGFERKVTRVLIGEEIDTKWAIKETIIEHDEDNNKIERTRWVIKDRIAKTSLPDTEESRCRTYNKKLDDIAHLLGLIERGKGLKIEEDESSVEKG